MNLGAMLHFNGKLEEAEQSYLMALKLKPEDQITRTNLNKLRNLLNKNGGSRWHNGVYNWDELLLLCFHQSYVVQFVGSLLYDDSLVSVKKLLVAIDS